VPAGGLVCAQAGTAARPSTSDTAWKNFIALRANPHRFGSRGHGAR
jgi:hypothetical protein